MGSTNKKNPKWSRDELILALDLYFKIDLSTAGAEHPKIVELSSILNKLPIHSERSNKEKFRNPNGVHMKLMNFSAIDPSYKGKGLNKGGKLEKIIWDEFADKPKYLSDAADRIKSILSSDAFVSSSYHFEDPDEEDFPEGKILYRCHKEQERNQRLVKKAKETAFKKHGRLQCQICGFDFAEKYGRHGLGYIECHHIIPVSQLDSSTPTKLKDLVLVCSNCHRMLHRKRPWLSADELKKLLVN